MSDEGLIATDGRTALAAAIAWTIALSEGLRAQAPEAEPALQAADLRVYWVVAGVALVTVMAMIGLWLGTRRRPR
jgi:uncharacterized membrane protein